ncbi:hypothetical protein BBL81_13955 [Vibrio parahaemolyticus]|uniref:hypothetical protein n=1 Tax=Vibrio TaxID=662 RepID=UPI00084A4995|nr:MULTISPECIES: hypothetical protein [Vibrio]EKA7352433.1 hypothetical protein [Vibrio vulnificus]ELP6741179.1 hypothetical protein [Vibrio vulnificus]MCU8221269.1 hypothetical protein [Vibrio vulnificus]ODW10006.1 hypothetical protein BBL80_18445 [Vibrio parahaemolyticus]ODW24442.1 hypothetical protein BBL81_13955 [Vibrio parahaemolyticus]
MRKTTQAKIARLLTSSLMSSDLTSKEVMDFCEALMHDDPFMKEFAYNLQNLVGNTMYSPSISQGDEDDELDYVYTLIKRRKLTKVALFTILDDQFNGLGSYLKSQRLTLRTAIEVARDNVDSDSWRNFVAMLRNDDYLDHILDREHL